MSTTFRNTTLVSALFALGAAPALAFVPFAKGELFVTGDLRAEYDSNIYTSSSQIDDTIFTFTPGFAFTRDVGLLKLNASTGLEIQRFVDNKRHDGENGQFNSQLLWSNEGGKTDAKANLGVNRTANANTDLNDRTVTDNYTFVGSFGHWATEKFGFRLLTDLSSAKSVSGGYKDVRKQLIGLDGRYQSSPKLEGVFGYSFRNTGAYNGSKTTTNIRSKDHAVSAGIEGELSGKLTGEVRAGYVYRDLTGGTIRSQSAPFARVALNWAAAEKTTFNLAVKKDFDTSAANQSINKFDVTLTATQQLLEKLTATAIVGMTHSNYIGGAAGRTDDSYNGRLMLNYRFTDRCSATAYVSGYKSTSTAAAAEFDRETVGLSLAFKF